MNKIMHNNEQRIRKAIVGTLMSTMPGGQVAAKGTSHTIGYIPVGAVIDNASVYIKESFGANVTVDFGTADNPKRFLDGKVVSVSANTDNKSPLLYVAPNGQPIVATFDTTGTADGVLLFEVSFTERDTRAGKYTA